jgi:hypothetical protein
VALGVFFLLLSVYDQFIVYEVDSLVAFVIGVVLLFRDPRARVEAGVLDAMLLSSNQTVAELASHASGYEYLPIGESVEDVVVVPTHSGFFDLPTGILARERSKERITPPGRALATFFLRESGLTHATMNGLATHLPGIVHDSLGLADSLIIRYQGDRVEIVLRSPTTVCRPKSDKTGPRLRGVVGCTVASFFSVLYCSASKRPVLLEDCIRDEAEDTWSIVLNLEPPARAIG